MGGFLGIYEMGHVWVVADAIWMRQQMTMLMLAGWLAMVVDGCTVRVCDSDVNRAREIVETLESVAATVGVAFRVVQAVGPCDGLDASVCLSILPEGGSADGFACSAVDNRVVYANDSALFEARLGRMFYFVDTMCDADSVSWCMQAQTHSYACAVNFTGPMEDEKSRDRMYVWMPLLVFGIGQACVALWLSVVMSQRNGVCEEGNGIHV